MDKLLEMLGIQKLDEAAQNEVKEKLQAIIEVKAKELANETLESEKEKLVEDYEKKFEDYKNEITNKFSDFVDSIFEEELTIPEKVLEFAQKGELYTDLIEQFKIRLSVDEGLLSEEVKSLLREAKSEIVGLREEINKIYEQNFELKTDAKELAAQVYLHEKCKGLIETQKEKVFTILEGITDKSEIDKKFDIVLEKYNNNNDDDDYDDDEDDDKKKKKKKKEEEMEEGKRSKIDPEKIEEDDKNPFNKYLEEYKKVLREGPNA